MSYIRNHLSTSQTASQRPQAMPSTPPLLRLPLELRQQIYTHLLPLETVSHPLPTVGITSVSHRMPTSALLNIHPQLTDEILATFYSLATFKLIFSHAFNFFRVDPDLRRLERSHSLRRIKKVELVFFCDILLLRDYPSFGLESFCAEIRRRAERACHVLKQAKDLNSVVISWIDTTLTGGWEQKATILQPLRNLGDKVTFRIGEINGPEDVDRKLFAEAMQRVLGDGRTLESGPDGLSEEPARLRMLAFDVRQDRAVRMEPARPNVLHRCRDCRGMQVSEDVPA